MVFIQGVMGALRLALLSVLLPLPVLFNPLTPPSSFSFFSPDHKPAERRLIDTAAAVFLSRRTSNQQPTRAIKTSNKKIQTGICLGIPIECSSKDLSHRLPEPLVLSLYWKPLLIYFLINLPNSFRPYSTFNISHPSKITPWLHKDESDIKASKE